MPRKLQPREEAAIAAMYERKAQSLPCDGFVTTTAAVPMRSWNGNHFPSVEANTTTEMVPAGTVLKIVMVSRFGDCGLSDDLTADYGYGLRLNFDDDRIHDIRLSGQTS
jgi:hypothetical protein